MNPYLLVLLSTLFAAAGQIFFKLGATGVVSIWGYANFRIGAGLALYGLSTVLWILALSKLPLSRVYPFTVLTFLLVYAVSFLFLGERPTLSVMVGAPIVLVGLLIITTF